MHAIEVCRTADLGGHVDECEECGHSKISYNSCRDRHCPKCQFLKKEKWVEARGKELLPIEYFHVVFTLPDELNPLALRNREVVYNILFKAASETLTELASKRLGVKAGFIAVLHTWGQNLMDHPPLHCIVSGRGLSQGKWISSKRKFLFPLKVMSRLFRGKGKAAQRIPFPVRNAVLGGSGPVRSDQPFYRPRNSPSGLILLSGPFDLPTYPSIRRKKALPTHPSSPNP